MAFSKLGQWFLTESGKKVVFGCATATSIGLSCCQYFPNVFLINQYRDLLQYCKNGFSLPIPEPLKQRIDKTMDLLELKPDQISLTQPFMTVGFEIFSAGSYWSRFGTIIGIPINFTYIDQENVDPSSIRVKNLPIQWDLPEAKAVLASLKLSEKAQIYAIARQIELRKTLKLYYDLAIVSAASLSAYSIGNFINVRLNLYTKPRSIRFFLYALVGSFSAINYFLFKDIGQVYFEEKVDNYLVKKNEIFKEGGVEYFNSILNRNVALRKIMGTAGESKFTALGNENNLIRTTHSPLFQRKLFFESQLQHS